MNLLDLGTLEALNRLVGLSSSFDALVVWLTFEHMLKGAVVAAVLWGLWFARLPAPQQRERRERLMAGMAAGFVGEVVARGLALGLPYRPRPMHNAALEFRVPATMPPGFLEGWSAFPSDHAVLFFAIGAGIAAASRVAGAWVLAYVTLAICLPRIYVGLHHPTDIVAGAAIGIGTAWLLQRKPARAAIAGPLLAWCERSPTWFYAAAVFFTLQFAVLFEGLRGLLRVGRLLL